MGQLLPGNRGLDCGSLLPRKAELAVRGTANDINSHMPDYVVHHLLLALDKRGRPVSGSPILLLGLSYKKNTSDAGDLP